MGFWSADSLPDYVLVRLRFWSAVPSLCIRWPQEAQCLLVVVGVIHKFRDREFKAVKEAGCNTIRINPGVDTLRDNRTRYPQ